MQSKQDNQTCKFNNLIWLIKLVQEICNHRISEIWGKHLLNFFKVFKKWFKTSIILHAINSNHGYFTACGINTFIRLHCTWLHGWVRSCGLRDTGLTAADAWALADDRSTWRVLRPTAGYVQQWVIAQPLSWSNYQKIHWSICCIAEG